MSDLIDKLRKRIGDIDVTEPNITDKELEEILKDSAIEYSRIRGYILFADIPYDKTRNVYTTPIDSFRIKDITLFYGDNYKLRLNFIDNLDQIVLNDEPNVDDGILKITYNKFFNPEDIDLRELDLLMLYAEGLCYKLMATKTAELIKFSTGEKTVDESEISKKYLDLYKNTVKIFRNKIIKSYGRRADNIKENLDYNMPYPPLGERP
jgi:iron only hydrogenase large subunit-like protein